MNKHKKIIFWLYSGCFLVFAMVVIGGITRLTGSGLSITEWKVITGTLPPLSEAQWQEEFAKYQATPQFQKINSHFDLSDFKNIYWWEYLHRFVGRLMGMVFLIPFIYFLVKNQISKVLLPKLIIIFTLGAWQGFLGWYMVSSGLVDNPYVSHYRLAIHLVNAFITFGYIFWVVQDLQNESSTQKNYSSKIVLRLSITTLIFLFVQLIYGAFVAGLHAGQVYNTWPKMEGEWIASTVFMAFDQNGLSSLCNALATVQFIHRTVALILFGLILLLWLKRNNPCWGLNQQQKFAINICMMVVMLQFLLGVCTLLFHVPVWLGVVHQAGAFLIFASVIFMIHKLKFNREKK